MSAKSTTVPQRNGSWIPSKTSPAPRDGLVRLLVPNKADEIEDRAARITLRAQGTDQPVMEGHFCVFNRWTEIDSFFEGRFMEKLAKGSAKKTMKENRSNIKVLFQHGRDMMIGSKPLGPIDVLREDDFGGRYEVPLLDAPYVRNEVQPGLAAGLYGASFRFSVMRDEWVEEPEPSEYNPQGIPERTIKEFRLSEFGPVTFPAYEDATAGLRSVTDDFILSGIAGLDPEIVRMAGEGASLGDLLAMRLGKRDDTDEEESGRERITIRNSRVADDNDDEQDEADEQDEQGEEQRDDEASDTGTTDEAGEHEDSERDDAAEDDEARDSDENVDDKEAAHGSLEEPSRETPRRPAEQDTPRYRRDDETAAPRSNRTPLHSTRKERWRL